MAEKNYMSTCGANVTEAHYFRNIARELSKMAGKATHEASKHMSKDKTLTDKGKAESLFKARAALTKALDAVNNALGATPEGRALLKSGTVAEPMTQIEALPQNVKARQDAALVAQAEAIAARKAAQLADTL